MKILLISTCKEKLSEYEFVNPIVEIIESFEYDIINYRNLETSDISLYDKIIICGTSLQDNDYLNYLDDFKKLKIHDKYILGICSGFQIICSMFDEKIIDKEEIGMINVKTKIPNSLVNGDFQAYNMHNFSAGEVKFFNILAKSEKTIQMISHKTLNIFGVSFHPEVRNEQILTNFLLI
jgi:GMP synthase (glutamine-hydrolysing)